MKNKITLTYTLEEGEYYHEGKSFEVGCNHEFAYEAEFDDSLVATYLVRDLTKNNHDMTVAICAALEIIRNYPSLKEEAIEEDEFREFAKERFEAEAMEQELTRLADQ
jgi:hypothetical protein